MKTAFHTGVSGLVAYQHMLDTIGNNIANINTVGFKRQSVSFEDLLYVRMNTKSAPDLLKGVGTKAAYTQLHADQGRVTYTGDGLDFTIAGDGFFQVDHDGRREFTRDGEFSIGLRSRRPYLTTSDGAYVLSMQGRRIELKEEFEERYVITDGQISTEQVPTGRYDLSELLSEIGIFRFVNPHALEPVSSTRYTATEASGAAARDNRGVCELVQGYREQSNTVLSDEMEAMIRAQRAYQASARVVSTADQLEEIVNSLRN